jgi:cytidylate kinase
MWAPIFTQNGTAVLAALDQLESELKHLRELIASGKRDDLVQLIEDSRRRRQAFGQPPETGLAGGAPAPVIAIDGPSGSGKGTVAAAIAEHLGWRLLDSGALYRVLADAALQRGVDLDDATALAALATDLEIRFSGEAVVVDGVDRTLAIRTEAVSAAASRVAAHEAVRAAMLDLQRAQRQWPGLVADGRDMGTVVFPDAALKVFLDASLEARAERRYIQLKNKGLAVSVSDLLATLEERDRRDRGRAVAPLRPADDAVLIDSTALTVDAVVARVLEAARVRGIVTRT